MNQSELVNSISYCGLICGLCHLDDQCDGCRSTASHCDNHSKQWGGCHHRNCCIKQQINGCWECKDFPCSKDLYGPNHDLRICAFARLIREEGREKLIEYIVANAEKGIRYGYRKDYDGKGSEEEVLELLRTGCVQKKSK